MAAVAVTWVGVGANAGKVLTCDTLTAAWLGGPSLAANTTNFVEGTQSLAEKVSNTTVQGYTIDTTDVIGEPFAFSSGGGNDGDHIYAWLATYEAWDTLAAGGFGIVVADNLATDSYGAWYVGPQAGFLGGWASYVINPSAAFDVVIVAGTASWTTGGNPAQLSGVDGFGARWKTIKTITGNTDNCFVDSVSVGTGYRLTAGDGVSTDGKFSDFITAEETTTTGRYGGLRGISGILFARCKLYIGAASGATSTEFTDSGFTVVWEKATLSNGTSSAVATTLYELAFSKGSGTTTIVMSNGSFAAVSPHQVAMTWTGSTSATLTNINVDRARLINVDGAVSWVGGQVTNSGKLTVTAGTPTLQQLALLNSVSTAAMEISAVSQLTNVSKLSFDGAGVGGAGSSALTLNLGAVGGASLTLTNVTFANRVAGSHDILIPADVTGHITINISGGSTPTVNDLRTPDDYEIVTTAVTATVTVKDTATPPVVIVDARVLLIADAGGPFPSDVAVAIVNAGTTATVTHATHGLSTADKVLINGASHWQNNGVFAVTRTDNDTYTYTLPSDPGSSPTGSIKATFVVLSGLTNGSGQITMTRAFSSAQPVSGRARKSTAPPYYKTATLVGSVSSTLGFTATVQLLPDA